MHYLIIRPGAIGDSLVAFPAIRALKAQNDRSSVTLVSNAAVLPLALAAGIAEEVSDYGSLQWSELFSEAGIRSPTMQKCLHDVDSAICWLRDTEGIVERNLRTFGIRHITIAPGRPAADEYIPIVDYLAHTLEMQTPIPFTSLLPICNGYMDEHQCIAIHPGSGGVSKCWPIAYFAALIKMLWQKEIPVLLLAGPADHERLAELLDLLPQEQRGRGGTLRAPGSPMRLGLGSGRTQGAAPTPLLSVLVDEPLGIIAQQLRHCRGYIGNDSGITHLAALLGTPTIVLFGPSNPAIWRPHGSLVKVLYEPVLKNLPPSIVMYTIEENFY